MPSKKQTPTPSTPAPPAKEVTPKPECPHEKSLKDMSIEELRVRA